MIRVFEAFAGIGTQRMALRNLGVDYEIVGISEIDKFAIKSYEAIHGETMNYGDIVEIDPDKLPDFDLFTYSFPCQDISVAGNKKGLEEGSGTRSSLLWECDKIIKSKRPKYLLMENVKNLVGKKFKPYFENWLEILAGYGYTNYWKILNAKHYGVPQNRERVFCVSILGEHELYQFPQPIELTLTLGDMLEDEVEEKFYLSQEIQDRLLFKPNFKNDIKTLGTTNPNATIGQRDVVYSDEGIVGSLLATDYKRPKQVGEIKEIASMPGTKGHTRYKTFDETGIAPTLTTAQGGGITPNVIAASRGREDEDGKVRQRLEVNKEGVSNALTTVQKDNLLIQNGTKKGYLEASEGDGVDIGFAGNKNRRGRVQKNMSGTINTTQDKAVVAGDLRIRKLTPLECWRLMGISDWDFRKAEAGCSNTQLYKQAGNAIVVDVLEGIFKEWFMR